MLLLDENLCVIRANPAFYRAFDVEPDSTVGVSLFALGNGQWDIPELRKLLGEVIPKAQAVVGFEVSHDFPSIGRRTTLVSARRMVREDNNSANLAAAFADVTYARKRAELARMGDPGRRQGTNAEDGERPVRRVDAQAHIMRLARNS